MDKKQNKKNKNDTIYAILTFAIIIIIAYFLVGSSGYPEDSKNDRRKCPYKTEGNLNASFVIKYVDSPYCFWCFLEEPILQRMIAEKGSSFRIERYDIRHCTDIVRKYGFSGTPSFVFSKDNGAKEYSHSGFIREEEFYKIICGATGDCQIEQEN